MDGTPARAFQAMMTLADAINRAGSTEPEAIQKALQQTDMPPTSLIMPWEGVKFDASGRCDLEIYLWHPDEEKIEKAEAAKARAALYRR